MVFLNFVCLLVWRDLSKVVFVNVYFHISVLSLIFSFIK